MKSELLRCLNITKTNHESVCSNHIFTANFINLIYCRPLRAGPQTASTSSTGGWLAERAVLFIVSSAGGRLMWFLQFVVIESKMCSNDATKTLGVLECDDPPSHLPTHPTHHGCRIITIWANYENPDDVTFAAFSHIRRETCRSGRSAALQRFIMMMFVHVYLHQHLQLLSFWIWTEFHVNPSSGC